MPCHWNGTKVLSPRNDLDSVLRTVGGLQSSHQGNCVLTCSTEDHFCPFVWTEWKQDGEGVRRAGRSPVVVQLEEEEA